VRRAATLIVAIVVLAGCGGGSNPALTFVEYGKRTPPAVPDRTSPLDAAWVDAGGGIGTAIADGDYWGTLADADTPVTVQLQLVQALIGSTCAAELGDDACDSGIGIVDTVTGTIDVDLAGLAAVSVVAADQQNYSVSGAEFGLLTAGTPNELRPDTFTFVVTYPFLVTVRNGAVVALAQIWTA
jgi:hypothetical protein